MIITGAIAFLTYLSCSSGSDTVFEWFQNLVTIATLFTWVVILIVYIDFRKALAAQGVDRNTLVFKSPYQPITAYVSLGFFILGILFNGFDTIAGGWDTDGFITDYIGIPIFFGLYFFWKILKRSHWRKPEEADLYTGKAALDAVEWPVREPRNILERIWYAFPASCCFVTRLTMSQVLGRIKSGSVILTQLVLSQ